MTLLLSDLLNVSTPHGRVPVSGRTGAQTIHGTDSNTMVMSNDTLDIAYTLDAAAGLGTSVRFVQGSNGIITFGVNTGGVYLNVLGFTRSGGVGAEMIGTVISNPDGASATWLVTGMMQ